MDDIEPIIIEIECLDLLIENMLVDLLIIMSIDLHHFNHQIYFLFGQLSALFLNNSIFLT